MESQKQPKCKGDEVPGLLEVIIKPSKNGKGFRGFVNEPENKHHRQLVLFPGDGREMDLAPHKVAFIVEREASQIPIQPKGFAMFATPVGEKSFFVSDVGRVLAENIIRERMGLPPKGLSLVGPATHGTPKKDRPAAQFRELPFGGMVAVTLLMAAATICLAVDIVVDGRRFTPGDLAVIFLLATIVVLTRKKKFPSPSES